MPCPTLAASLRSNSWECFLFSRWDQISPIWTAETFHCALHAEGKAQGEICCWPDSVRESLAFLISRLFLQEFSSLYSFFICNVWALACWQQCLGTAHLCPSSGCRAHSRTRLGVGLSTLTEPLLWYWDGTVLPTWPFWRELLATDPVGVASSLLVLACCWLDGHMPQHVLLCCCSSAAPQELGPSVWVLSRFI